MAVNRSDIFRRAHELARSHWPDRFGMWDGNRRKMFGYVLRLAWGEWKAGKMPCSTAEAIAARKGRVVWLAREIDFEEAADRCYQAARIVELRREQEAILYGAVRIDRKAA